MKVMSCVDDEETKLEMKLISIPCYFNLFIFHPLLQVQSPILLKLTDLAPPYPMHFTNNFIVGWELIKIYINMCVSSHALQQSTKTHSPNLQNLF